MKKGFTLLEVIITLLMLGVIVFTVFTVFNQGIAIVHHNYLKQQAIDLASSYLEAETYNGPTVTIPNPYPHFQVHKNVNRHGAVSEVEVIVNWSDTLNKNANITLTRNYYLGVN